MRLLILATAAVGLAGCATAVDQPAQRSATNQATYDKLLAGKTAGRPAKCLPLRSSNDMVVIDDDTILYREGRTIYVNKPLGSCSLLSRGSYALVTRSIGSQLCRGDIGTVTDMTSGTTVGSCSLGDFVPYRPAP